MGLKYFAEMFANNIFSLYPEWRKYGRNLEYDEYEISVPVPFQRDKHDILCIFIEEECEVVVRFATYYGYFCTFCYDSDHEWLNDIFKFIQGILDETLVVVTTLHDNLIKCEVIESYKLLNFTHEIFLVRSWKGTFDKD